MATNEEIARLAELCRARPAGVWITTNRVPENACDILRTPDATSILSAWDGTYWDTAEEAWMYARLVALLSLFENPPSQTLPKRNDQ